MSILVAHKEKKNGEVGENGGNSEHLFLAGLSSCHCFKYIFLFFADAL
jgi:organic hydroperoxide reductase OsmC/OhrA